MQLLNLIAGWIVLLHVAVIALDVCGAIASARGKFIGAFLLR